MLNFKTKNIHVFDANSDSRADDSHVSTILDSLPIQGGTKEILPWEVDLHRIRTPSYNFGNTMLREPKQISQMHFNNITKWFHFYILTYQMGIYIVLSIWLLLCTFWVYINPLCFFESSLTPFFSSFQNLLSAALL